jgi:hypothetical protein
MNAQKCLYFLTDAFDGKDGGEKGNLFHDSSHLEKVNLSANKDFSL